MNSRFKTMPRLLLLGLVVLLGGAATDLVYHSLPSTMAAQLEALGSSGHLVTFIGMLLMASGLVQRELTSTLKGWRSRSCHSVHSSTPFRRPSS